MRRDEKSTNGPHSGDIEYYQCCICFEDYNSEKGGDLTGLSGCVHAVCSQCVSSLNNSCPVCREKFNPKKNKSHRAIKGIFAAAKQEREKFQGVIATKEEALQLDRLANQNEVGRLKERMAQLEAALQTASAQLTELKNERLIELNTQSRGAVPSVVIGNSKENMAMVNHAQINSSLSEQKAIPLTEADCQEFLRFFESGNENITDDEFLKFIQCKPGILNGEIKCKIDDETITSRALFIAAVNTHLNFFRLLLEHGSDPNFIAQESVIFCSWQPESFWMHRSEAKYSVLEVCIDIWISMNDSEFNGIYELDDGTLTRVRALNLYRIILSILECNQLTYENIHEVIPNAFNSMGTSSRGLELLISLLKKMQEIQKKTGIISDSSPAYMENRVVSDFSRIINIFLNVIKPSPPRELQYGKPQYNKLLQELLLKTYPQLLASAKLEGLNIVFYYGLHLNVDQLYVFAQLEIDLQIDAHCEKTINLKIEGFTNIDWTVKQGELPLTNLIRFKNNINQGQSLSLLFVYFNKLHLLQTIDEVISFFIKRMININAREVVINGPTALELACAMKDLKTINALLSRSQLEGVKEAMETLQATKESYGDKKQFDVTIGLMQKHLASFMPGRDRPVLPLSSSPALNGDPTTESTGAVASDVSSDGRAVLLSSEQKEIPLTEELCQEFLKFFDPKNNKTKEEFRQFIQNNPGVVNGEIKCHVDGRLIETRALFIAVVNLNVDFFNLLLEQGANPNLVTENETLVTYCPRRSEGIHLSCAKHSVLSYCYQLLPIHEEDSKLIIKEIITSILECKQLFEGIYPAINWSYRAGDLNQTILLLEKLQKLRNVSRTINLSHDNYQDLMWVLKQILRHKDDELSLTAMHLLIKNHPQLLQPNLMSYLGLPIVFYYGLKEPERLFIFDQFDIDLHIDACISETREIYISQEIETWIIKGGQLPLTNLICLKKKILDSGSSASAINETISFFIRKMININARETRDSRATALEVACEMRDLETIQTLLSIRARDLRGVEEAMAKLKSDMTSTKNKKKVKPILELMQKHIERQKAANPSDRLVSPTYEEKRVDVSLQHHSNSLSSSSLTSAGSLSSTIFKQRRNSQNDSDANSIAFKK